jgi:hypothetical protein
MRTSHTIQFTELETFDEGLIVMRSDERSVALALSIKTNGDMEVVMSKVDAKRLLEALSEASD